MFFDKYRAHRSKQCSFYTSQKQLLPESLSLVIFLFMIVDRVNLLFLTLFIPIPIFNYHLFKYQVRMNLEFEFNCQQPLRQEFMFTLFESTAVRHVILILSLKAPFQLLPPTSQFFKGSRHYLWSVLSISQILTCFSFQSPYHILKHDNHVLKWCLLYQNQAL